MSVEITNTSGLLVPANEMQSLMSFAFKELDLHVDCELNMVFVDDEEMTKLHIKWMNEEGTTDVLSFPMDLPDSKEQAVTLGDIVISPRVAAEQAKSGGHSVEHEIFILATHGLLHILGYDHVELADELIMFELQESIVAKWKSS
ncbi:MAG: rRNA maturation RNase YbeY [Actinobacteria bacterium]|nr:rRNA maturation RNase YbeY [Actinomycetota bacterium]